MKFSFPNYTESAENRVRKYLPMDFSKATVSALNEIDQGLNEISSTLREQDRLLAEFKRYDYASKEFFDLQEKYGNLGNLKARIEGYRQMSNSVTLKLKELKYKINEYYASEQIKTAEKILASSKASNKDIETLAKIYKEASDFNDLAITYEKYFRRNYDKTKNLPAEVLYAKREEYQNKLSKYPYYGLLASVGIDYANGVLRSVEKVAVELNITKQLSDEIEEMRENPEEKQ